MFSQVWAIPFTHFHSACGCVGVCRLVLGVRERKWGREDGSKTGLFRGKFGHIALWLDAALTSLFVSKPQPIDSKSPQYLAIGKS